MKKTKIYISETPLIKEWDFEKNVGLDPKNLTIGSGKRVWWLCEKGHSWDAVIKDRNRHATGCPYCSGQRVCEDNCLATLRPDIAAQWHYTLNNALTPNDVTCGSDKKVWWVCERRHEWKARVNSRVGGNGCRLCNKRKVKFGNDVASVYPRLINEWHPTKNKGSTPYNTSYGSEIVIWWLCKKGHEWSTKLSVRTSNEKSECPFCAGKRVCKDNSLAVLRPDIAAQWHPTKNGKLTAKNVLCGSSKVVWWQCEKNHEWRTMVHNRTKNNSNCPYCAGQKTVYEKSLFVLRPDLMLEWCHRKNIGLSAKTVSCGSNKRVWWECPRGHIWKTSVCARNCGYGCPVCSMGSVSSISQRWLDKLSIPVEKREITLPDLKIRVDAFVPETNTVYEFLGDYWHGNPEVYDENQEHPVLHKTFGQLYDETKARVSRLEEAGYKVVYVWEKDYLNGLMVSKTMGFSVIA